MKIDYRVINAEEGKRVGAPAPPWEESWDDAIDSWYPNLYLYRFEDGVPVEYLAQDGGEPEDQSLSRDWCWVPVALNKAYELGKKHGIEAEYNRLQDKV